MKIKEYSIPVEKIKKKITLSENELKGLEKQIFLELAQEKTQTATTLKLKRLNVYNLCGGLIASKEIKERLKELYEILRHYETTTGVFIKECPYKK